MSQITTRFSTAGPIPIPSMPAFGNIYNQAVQDVLPGTNWTFDSNGPLLNISHVAGSDSITINVPGTFLVTFVSGTSDDFQQNQFLVNGVAIPQMSYFFSPNPGGAGDVITTNALITFAAGDVVTIKNTGVTDVFIDGGAPYTNASITFEKINTSSAGGGNFQGSVTTIGAVTGDMTTIPLGIVAGTFSIGVRLGAFEASTPAGAGYSLTAAFRTDGATATLIGSVDQILNEDAALVAGDATMVTSGNSVIVRVTGVAGLTINWSGIAEIVGVF